MAQRSIYEDIARRTGGDIYIGVVGPVRSGKSTFITRFMQEMVLPSMTDEAARERARDEMPQSAAGKTVMTTEPKFVPEQAISLTVDGGTTLKVKMIDCVGYMIPDAKGVEENGEARMVSTPWQKEPMPFADAAEYGTRKVMQEHATIGMLVSCDGSIGEIPRTSYAQAEERLVREMKASGKPFALLLNSAQPSSREAKTLAEELEKKYGVPVALLNCLTLDAKDISGILQMVLGEFPVCTVRFTLPPFAAALPKEHPIRASLTQDVCRLASALSHEHSGGLGIHIVKLQPTGAAGSDGSRLGGSLLHHHRRGCDCSFVGDGLTDHRDDDCKRQRSHKAKGNGVMHPLGYS